MTYGTLISTVTVGAGGASAMTFSSIPATYTDLLIVFSVRDTNGAVIPNTYMSFNGDTAANYKNRWLLGTGTGTGSQQNLSTGGIYFYNQGSGATANTFGNTQIYIPNYAGSTQKSVSVDAVTENNSSQAGQSLDAGLWTGTAAINSITFGFDSTAAQYSTASLYGIK
jgi:hypothetical protein